MGETHDMAVPSFCFMAVPAVGVRISLFLPGVATPQLGVVDAASIAVGQKLKGLMAIEKWGCNQGRSLLESSVRNLDFWRTDALENECFGAGSSRVSVKSLFTIL